MQSSSTTATDSLWPATLLNAAGIPAYKSEDSQAAIAQCLLGFDHFQHRAYAQAMPRFEQALALLEATAKFPLLEAIALGYMGQIYTLKSQYWYALACYEAALDACQTEDSTAARYCQMKLYGWLAELCQRCGHDDLANDYCSKALYLRHQLNQDAQTQPTYPVSCLAPSGLLPLCSTWN